MSKFGNSLSWVFGILFLIASLGGFLDKQWYVAFGFLITGCFLLPYTQNLILEGLDNKITKNILIIAAIVSCFAGVLLQPEKLPEFKSGEIDSQVPESSKNTNSEKQAISNPTKPTSKVSTAKQEKISVPSDAKATYEVVFTKKVENGIEILTKRSGTSGISYALRFYNCKGKFKYLGEGDTQAEAESKNSSDSKLSDLTNGSISTYVGEYACKKKFDTKSATEVANKKLNEALSITEWEDKTTNIQAIQRIRLAKDTVGQSLRDPSSVDFRNVFYRVGKTGIPVVCGEFNAKNSFGGYAGYQKFLTNGSNILATSESVSDFHKLWNEFCAD